MRLMVFFDLPTTSYEKKKAYAKFRRFLLNDGYDLIQWSVYSRLLIGRNAEQKHIKRLKENLPPEGSIRCITITEKQFAGIQLLIGLPKNKEKKVNANQLLLF